MESFGAILKRLQAQCLEAGSASLTDEQRAELDREYLDAQARICPVCRDQRVVRHDVAFDHPDFGKAFPCPECGPSREADRLVRQRRQLPEAQRENTFASLRKRRGLTAVQDAKWAEACRVAIAFASGNPATPWLVLAGSIGSSKTHLAVCIANYRIDHPEAGPPALWTNVVELLAELRGAIATDALETRMETFRECPLLILDDLGAEKDTEWVREQLYRVVNHRYFEKLPMVITTNEGVTGLDPRIASRIRDETNGVATVLLLDLPDARVEGTLAGKREVTHA